MNGISSKMPKFLAFLPNDYLIVLEDLGKNSDFTFLYGKNTQISENEIVELAEFLSDLHSFKVSNFPNNLELKRLNHFHIFEFPFDENNNFNLDNIQIGLSEIAKPIISDQNLKVIIKQLGQKYLASGSTLIHGDFYPGSWLKTESGTKIIDPEFSHLGLPEFDLGIFMAHMAISQQNQQLSTLMANYKKMDNFDDALMYGFAGIEILRRLLGVAQLPIFFDLDQKRKLLLEAVSLITTQTK